MSFALSAGISGLQAHQKMLDIAGNNLANVNTTAFKSSNITFAELLSQTVRKGSQPTNNLGGTNPQQVTSGVKISNISRNMTQGNLMQTGNPLDLAIEGEGYFVLNDGSQNVYTRAGSFSVDAANNLVDPSTGYKVQRFGSTGEAEGFQMPGNDNIKIPNDAAMPAKVTTEVTLSGNLSANAEYDTPQKQEIVSNLAFTNSENPATLSTKIIELDQFDLNGVGTPTGDITISGYDKDGNALSSGLTFSIDDTTTMQDFIDHLNNNVFSNATATLDNGQIKVEDDSGGYSKLDMNLTYSDTSGEANATEFETPAFFEITKLGGEEAKSTNITIYDSQGGKHVMYASLVRTDTANQWDMVLQDTSGDVASIGMDNRRIEGITFNSDGSFDSVATDTEFSIAFGHDPGQPQNIDINLGTPGKWDGLTQFKGDSTAVAKDQDGYEAGKLSSISVNNEGIVIGSFSNGMKREVAAIKLSLFQNTRGLESLGGGYYIPSGNSGDPIDTKAVTGGAGIIHGGHLEKSNADVATEFVNMIEAQNGFQSNARTITVANDILRELTNIIR